MKITKIYDCSNSIERPINRKNGGPIENDIVRYLKRYANEYNCQFVNNPKIADVLFTNDVFPKDVLDLSIPKVKRMDGVFFQNQFKERNESLNLAACQADQVIFISEFSRQSFYTLYNHTLKNDIVVLNQVDPSEYYRIGNRHSYEPKIFCASAASWEREEKRLNAVISFAKIHKGIIYLIGKCSKRLDLPKNIISLGYISDNEETNIILNKVDAYLNTSYRDAAPKTVAQALNVGIPVLYADSGGVNEMVKNCGVGFKDYTSNTFQYQCNEVYIDVISKGFEEFKYLFETLRYNSLSRNNQFLFRNMLDDYFKIIKSF
jgi:glycosyltransferase involved in cell wall biosynthesis